MNVSRSVQVFLSAAFKHAGAGGGHVKLRLDIGTLARTFLDNSSLHAPGLANVNNYWVYVNGLYTGHY